MKKQYLWKVIVLVIILIVFMVLYFVIAVIRLLFYSDNKLVKFKYRTEFSSLYVLRSTNGRIATTLYG